MVNPGICRRCTHCQDVSECLRDDRGLIRIVSVDCALEPGGIVVGHTPIPEDCPYLLEHKLTEEHTEDMVEGWEKEQEEQKNAARL